MTEMAVPAPLVRPRPGTYAGVFLITLSTLMYEIALTRIFSVTMWYHFAFVAISVALFGMTAGALLVHLFPGRFVQSAVKGHLWRYSLVFSVTIAACFVIQLSIPFDPRLTVAGIASVVTTCVVISIPFVASGVVVCLALTRFPGQVNRLYAVDLAGAGLGCVLLVLLFTWFDGPSLVIFVGALAAAGGLMFAADAGERRGKVLATLLVVGLGGFAVLNAELNADGRALLEVKWTKGARDGDHTYERWNAFSRLTVDGNPESDPFLNLVIDSTAGTALNRYIGDEAEANKHRSNISRLAHHVRPDADIMVVGVGGGGDVLAALKFDPRSVTGAEINGDILEIANGVYGDFTGHLDRDPRVKFVNDEARSYLAGTDKKFDIIQISLIDTWAATSAGAFALSENGLYTTDAWDVYFDRLKPGGILTVTRYYSAPGTAEPLETARLIALASQALTDRGVEDPRQHALVYSVDTDYQNVALANMLVSPKPFTAADRSTLSGQVEKSGFTPVLTPDTAILPMFANLMAPGGPGPAVDDRPEDLSAPTDDRPYFFQMADFGTFFSSEIFSNKISTRPVLVLGLLAVTVLALAAACIFLPLLVGRRRRHERAPPKGIVPFYTYFAGIGFGFLLIEISQLQRLSIFLGHPTYALTVVLFSILLSSGAGSMLTERILRADRPVLHLAPLLSLLGTLVVYGFATRHVIDAMDGASTSARIGTAVAMLVPLGLLMGMPFSIGMRAAAGRRGTPTAFLWGINGATSVCASVLSVVIALFFGISTAFWAGGLAYVVAAVSMALIVRSSRSSDDPHPLDLRGEAPASETAAQPVADAVIV